ncbi:hypothetical protein E3N88_33022 [Mikania micrantha]|uniref:Uncharacterized protein n=1 Tax=Mikania micrantha TaxID=192012 RepID=A0A5N6MAM4_9ASTR|nr:hypothetical protein E3N88_33022 [Mikania micrantha]
MDFVLGMLLNAVCHRNDNATSVNDTRSRAMNMLENLEKSTNDHSRGSSQGCRIMLEECYAAISRPVSCRQWCDCLFLIKATLLNNSTSMFHHSFTDYKQVHSFRGAKYCFSVVYFLQGCRIMLEECYGAISRAGTTSCSTVSYAIDVAEQSSFRELLLNFYFNQGMQKRDNSTILSTPVLPMGPSVGSTISPMVLSVV